jgi:tyrosyl-tRNA synthetase
VAQLKEVDLSILGRTTDEIFSLAELKEKLALGRPLLIKYGVDVTAPFLHLGHAVNLWMMRYLQECGHKVQFLIGDFTTLIGDPTGKSKARKVPPAEEIEANSQEFIRQVGEVLLTDPDVFEVRRNSEWFASMPVHEFLGIVGMVTHARLIQRDMFQRRIAGGDEIYMNEMLYPILQGYDSRELESDLTIVGSDQLFNEMMGRFYQERFGQKPQIVITTKITPGTDGKQKQSKSLGNYIAIADSPRDKFGKVMSIPDELIVSYLTVYTMVPMDEVKAIEAGLADGTVHPMDAKKRLGSAIVGRYHGDDVGAAERAWFEETFSKRQTPDADDMPTVHVSTEDTPLDVLSRCEPGQSRGALKRLVKQGGVKVDDVRMPFESVMAPHTFADGAIVRMGKLKWFRVALRDD